MPLPVPVLTVTVYVVPLPVTVVNDAPETPEAATAKSEALTPVTDSLKTTLNCTDDAAVGVEPARLIETTVGAMWSSVKTWPVKLPLPAPGPPSAVPKPEVSMMVSSSVRLRPSVPLPEPLLAETVYVVPLPVTPVMDAQVTPLATSAKSVVSTPVTDSEKVTVQLTDAAAVVALPTRLMETTVGAFLSMA